MEEKTLYTAGTLEEFIPLTADWDARQRELQEIEGQNSSIFFQFKPTDVRQDRLKLIDAIVQRSLKKFNPIIQTFSEGQAVLDFNEIKNQENTEEKTKNTQALILKTLTHIQASCYNLRVANGEEGQPQWFTLLISMRNTLPENAIKQKIIDIVRKIIIAIPVAKLHEEIFSIQQKINALGIFSIFKPERYRLKRQINERMTMVRDYLKSESNLSPKDVEVLINWNLPYSPMRGVRHSEMSDYNFVQVVIGSYLHKVTMKAADDIGKAAASLSAKKIKEYLTGVGKLESDELKKQAESNPLLKDFLIAGSSKILNALVKKYKLPMWTPPSQQLLDLFQKREKLSKADQSIVDVLQKFSRYLSSDLKLREKTPQAITPHSFVNYPYNDTKKALRLMNKYFTKTTGDNIRKEAETFTKTESKKFINKFGENSFFNENAKANIFIEALRKKVPSSGKTVSKKVPFDSNSPTKRSS